MANVSLVFHSSELSGLESKAECFLNTRNEIVLQVYTDKEDPYYRQVISLDKSTAIKLAKTLRTEINKIQS